MKAYQAAVYEKGWPRDRADHPGAWNWDGLWPDWNLETFRLVADSHPFQLAGRT